MQGLEICSSLACLALVYELTVGDDVGDRAGSEGSYYDALSTWQMYAKYCICNPDSEQEPWKELCSILFDKLVERAKDYLALWGGMRAVVNKVDPEAFSDFIENVLAPVYRQYCSPGPSPRSPNYVHAAAEIFRRAWGKFVERKSENRELYTGFGETAFFQAPPHGIPQPTTIR